MPSSRVSRDSHAVSLPRVARSRLAIVFLVVVVITGAMGVVAGLLIPRSDAADGLADTEPAVVTAAVEERVVEESVSVQGTVQAGREVTVEFTATDDPDTLPYVTASNKKPGEEIASGSVLLAVAGRPRLVLALDYPLYRSLRVGDTGADVQAFEAALAEHISGDFDVDDEFTENTMSAASLLWERSGYVLPTEEAQVTVPVSTPMPTASASPVLQAVPIRVSYVDVREILQVPKGQTKVSSIAELGELATPDEPLAVLASGVSAVQVRVSLLHETAFAVGTKVDIRAEGHEAAQSTVVSLGEFEVPGEGDEAQEDGAGRDAVVDIPASWEDVEDGLVVQISPSSSAEPVLALPLTSIRDASTDPFVILEDSVMGKPGDRLSVDVLGSGDGWVEIDPNSGLVVGDTVRVTP